MADKTGISWTDATWNPVRGCSRVSEGCRNCYAERVAARFCDPGQAYEGLARRVLKTDGLSQPRWTGEVRLVTEHLADPIRWRRPRRIFVNSMSDLFHEKLSNEQIAAVFGVMAAAPQHTFQILTKRATRMREWFAWAAGINRSRDTYDWTFFAHQACRAAGADLVLDRHVGGEDMHLPWPLRNVWIGVSTENQETADERIPELLATPAAVRFLSCEPLLGPVDLEHVRHQLGRESYETGSCLDGDDGFGLSAARERVDWVIAGCESGPGARPCDVAWLRSLRDQCASASVPFFLKQAARLRGSDEYSGDSHRIEMGRGSKAKAGGVIELPYLDGEQHAEFPVPA